MRAPTGSGRRGVPLTARRDWVWVPALMVGVGLALLLVAYSLPAMPIVKQPPDPGGNLTEAETRAYSAALAAYNEFLANAPSVMLSQSLVDIAEGLILSSLAVLAWVFRDHGWGRLERPLAPGFPKKLAVGLALAGAATYVVFVLFDATLHAYLLWDTVAPSLSAQRSPYYGIVALSAWALASVMMALRNGVVPTVRAWGLPSVLLLELAILVGVPTEMCDHVMNIAPWSVDGVYVLSNWTVLVIVTTLLGLAAASGSWKASDGPEALRRLFQTLPQPGPREVNEAGQDGRRGDDSLRPRGEPDERSPSHVPGLLQPAGFDE